MSLSRYPQVTQELLSAYLDDAVSMEERELVEHAAVYDAEIAQRLESLHHTVQLLRALPAVALPRSFTLDVLMVEIAAKKATEARQWNPTRTRTERAASSSWWQRFVAGLQGVTPYRAAALVVLVLLVTVVAGNWNYLYPNLSPAMTQELSSQEVAFAIPQIAEQSEAAPTVILMQESASADSAAQNDEPEKNSVLETVESTAVADLTLSSNPGVDAERGADSLPEADNMGDTAVTESPAAENPVIPPPISQDTPVVALVEAPTSVGSRLRTIGSGVARSGAAAGPNQPGDDIQNLNPDNPAADSMDSSTEVLMSEVLVPGVLAFENRGNPAGESNDDTGRNQNGNAALMMAASAVLAPDRMESEYEDKDTEGEIATDEMVETEVADSDDMIAAASLADASGAGADVAGANVTAAQALPTATVVPTLTLVPLSTPLNSLLVTPESTSLLTVTPTSTGTVTATWTATAVPTKTPLAQMSNHSLSLLSTPIGVASQLISLTTPLFAIRKQE